MKLQKTIFPHQAAWLKPVIIFVLLLILLIPLGFIKSLIYDREHYQRKAEESIMEPAGGEPVIEGLVLAVPYEKRTEYKTAAGDIQQLKHTYYILQVPETYEFSAQINPYRLSRGIFTVPVFNGTVSLQAVFSKFAFTQFNIEEDCICYKDAVLILGVQNKKTFTAYPALKINGTVLEESLVNPAEASPFDNAVYYNVPETLIRSGFALDGSITVQGGKSLSIIPLAADNRFIVNSTWSAPSFSGGWLPKSRTVTPEGFSADWSISGLSTVFPRTWNTEYSDTVKNAAVKIDTPEAVAIGFITPINHYAQVKRCVTYALLFLAVPFLAIFLCELWSAIRVHPIQYFLIGIADILFYLLLLSISEHLPFGVSYLIATVSVCTVVCLYAAAVFRHFRWGLLLTIVQAISYVLLFGILQSEDYALLIGSIGIFSVVAVLMFLTRKIDWYARDFTISLDHPENTETE
ncbi:MAG: cell envelope integrity protein CreD [Treponema sp.]